MRGAGRAISEGCFVFCRMMIYETSIEDIPLIRSIAVRTWPAAYGTILSHGQIAYMLDLFYGTEALEQQFLTGHRFLLFSEGDAVLGFAGYEMNYEPQIAKLHKLYVLPEAQGMRAGNLLLEAVKSAARAQEQLQVILNVNRFNQAKEFYEKNGFAVLREEDIDIGNGYFMNDYIMGFDCPG